MNLALRDPAGTTPTVTVGTVSSGTTAAVTANPTDTGISLDFVVPVGPAGPQEESGPTGPQGPEGPQGSGAKPGLRVNLALRDPRARHLPSLWNCLLWYCRSRHRQSDRHRDLPGLCGSRWPRGRKVNLVKIGPEGPQGASLGRLLKLQWSKIHLLSTRFGLKLRRQIS